MGVSLPKTITEIATGQTRLLPSSLEIEPGPCPVLSPMPSVTSSSHHWVIAPHDENSEDPTPEEEVLFLKLQNLTWREF